MVEAESTLMMNLNTRLFLSRDHNELERVSSAFYPQHEPAAPKSSTLLSASSSFTPLVLVRVPFGADLPRSWNSFISNAEPLSRGLSLSTDLTPPGHTWWRKKKCGEGKPARVLAPHLHFAESIIGHLVHEAVEQSGWASFVHSELSLRGEVVALLKTREAGSAQVEMSPNRLTKLLHLLLSNTFNMILSTSTVMMYFLRLVY